MLNCCSIAGLIWLYSCPSCNALCCYAIPDQLGGVAHSFCTTVKRLSESKKHCKLSDVEHSVILWSVFAIGSALAYLLFFQECATCPGTSLHVTQFYQAFPRVSTASDKHWGEKAWVQGYFRPRPLSLVKETSNFSLRIHTFCHPWLAPRRASERDYHSHLFPARCLYQYNMTHITHAIVHHSPVTRWTVCQFISTIFLFRSRSDCSIETWAECTPGWAETGFTENTRGQDTREGGRK